MRLHVDTDFAGNPDDACALAMVLGWPDAEVVGITTTADPDGRRAGYVEHFLRMLGADGVPVAAGAGRSLTTGGAVGDLPDHKRFWGETPPPLPRGPGVDDALAVLDHSISLGATVVAIGPCSNLALLERAHPGALSGVRVVTMGGWVFPFGAGFPGWGPERDWNVACDPEAALTLFESRADLTFVPCAAAAAAALRTTDVARLAATGPVGALLARQSVSHGTERDHAALGRAHEALPDDLVNFHWDPVTCAAALGWSGVRCEEMQLRPVLDGHLRFEPHRGGRRTTVVTGVRGEAFTDVWLAAVANAQGGEPAAWAAIPGTHPG